MSTNKYNTTTLEGIYTIYRYYWRRVHYVPPFGSVVHRFIITDDYYRTHEIYVESVNEIIAVLALLNNGYIINEYLGKTDATTPL